MRIALKIIIIALIITGDLSAKHLHHEKWYQQKWCSGNHGEIEIVLPDLTRADCITKTHAIEFDFGENWAESIGQSLNYSLQTGKRAGIVLIIEQQSDYRYWLRLNSIIDHFGLSIDVWKMEKLK